MNSALVHCPKPKHTENFGRMIYGWLSSTQKNKQVKIFAIASKKKKKLISAPDVSFLLYFCLTSEQLLSFQEGAIINQAT